MQRYEPNGIGANVHPATQPFRKEAASKNALRHFEKGRAAQLERDADEADEAAVRLTVAAH